MIIKKTATEHIQSIQDGELSKYGEYLAWITPQTPEATFRRWLFTYASVHTGWQMNCKLYIGLRDMQWVHNKTKLLKTIKDTRAGMHNKRANYIHAFSEFYWAHPGWFQKTGFETWLEYRDRIQDAAPGIGRAKASFAVELTQPLTAQTICVDTHIQQLYGYTSNIINNRGVKLQEAAAMEEHWVHCCADHNVPPVAARWIYWDRKQGYTNSRYWSFVLEGEDG